MTIIEGVYRSMPIFWKTKKGWEFEFILPAIPRSEFGTAVVMTGYFLVLEAIWKNL